MLLKNKVAIITGSTTGIGEAIAQHAVAEGAVVMIHGRDEARAKALCAQLGNEKAKYVIGDLKDLSVCDEIVDATLKAFGQVDVLVNNAALPARDDIDSLTEEKFDGLINLNVRAPLFLSKKVIACFKKQGKGGSIVNIGSINAYCGQSDLLVYSMTKGALMTMTRNLGNALGQHKIRVNQLNVGWTLTANEAKIKESEGLPTGWEQYVPSTYAPSGKLLRPADIARHAVFWASDASAPANGVVFDLEQYPVIGRNLINEVPSDVFKGK